jgi:hypothetical protein
MPYQQNSRSNSSAMALARGLGWFSIGLGLTEMLMPRMLTEQMGMQGKESLLRFYGAREMAAGIGILMSDNPGPWIWGRVAGDALDLATLATGLDKQNPRKGNVAIALAAVAGVTALDCISAQASPARRTVKASRCAITAIAVACHARRKKCAAPQETISPRRATCAPRRRCAPSRANPPRSARPWSIRELDAPQTAGGPCRPAALSCYGYSWP